MPPPTSWNPVPHIYFLSWKIGVHRYLCTVQRVEISPPMTSCSLCGALPFDVNLCRNRRLHEENNIIWGSLCLGRWGFYFLFFNPLLPGSVNREQLSPVCHISLLNREKVQLSVFTCAPRNSSSHPCILYLSHISPHILSPFSP